ncbi:MAG: hypothetical protein MRZ90_01850 [Candidatus Gastranaerophilales bacterium]|nr:hypothetical protein [Candidatus Gastranaerophilales bacterium]
MSLKITNFYVDANEVIDFIETYIANQKLTTYEIDISSLSLFDAIKISVLISTKYYDTDNNIKFKWVVNDKLAYNTISKLKLSNMFLHLKNKNILNPQTFTLKNKACV